MRTTRIELIGHRGAPTECHENTLEAFARAFALGADGIELDVHGSADGVVVVHHDAQLGPDVEPVRWRGCPLREMSADQVHSVRLPGGGGIPTLAEVLSNVPTEATAYVELKGSAIEELVARAIRTSHRRCAVHSFDHAAIERIFGLAPEIPRGLLFDQYPGDLRDAIKRTHATAVWLEQRLPDQAIVAEAHAMGARVYAWTVNDSAGARRLAELGVDALCSDDLRLLGFLR